MSSNFYKDFEAAAQALGAEIAERAYAAARYDVQDDFNNELVDYVARSTGHDSLAATVFVEVELDSYDVLNVNKYTEEAYVAGIYTSKSSYHQGYEGWKPVKKFKRMSRDEFWEMRESGADEGHPNYGGVQAGWMTDNFWNGIVYCTNGWPLGEADFLQEFKIYEKSAASAVEDYIRKYQTSNRFSKHVQKEINEIIK